MGVLSVYRRNALPPFPTEAGQTRILLISNSTFLGYTHHKMALTKRPVVFVSSTSDLEQHRITLRNSLPAYDVWHQPEGRAGSSIEGQLRLALKHAQVFVGLVGGSFGSITTSRLPGVCNTRKQVDVQGCFFVPDPRNTSMTMWEFSEACALNLEILPFVFTHCDDLPPDPRQSVFRERLLTAGSGAWCITYENDSATDLIQKVRLSLDKWRNEYWVPDLCSSARIQRYTLMALLTCGSCSGLLTLISVGLLLIGSVDFGRGLIASVVASAILFCCFGMVLLLPRTFER